MNAKILVLVSIFSYLTEILTKLKIIGPKELAARFGDKHINVTYAEFGHVPYGFFTRGRIFYDTQDKQDDYACSPLRNIILQSNPMNPDYYPIIMVDRGNCSFVTKARNVQDLGGYMALIVNNVPESDIDIMADDETGNDIIIPTVMITQQDGKIIENFFMENKDKSEVLEQISMAVEFLIKPSSVVDIDMFFESSAKAVYSAMIGFYPYYKLLGNLVNFKPHYITFPDYFYDESKPVPTANCFSKGRYCYSEMPDLGISDGKNIIMQNLIQICLFRLSSKKETTEENNNQTLYWDYMGEFFTKCYNITNTNFTQECSEDVLLSLGFDIKKLRDCLSSSFGSTVEAKGDVLENPNTLLESEYIYKIKNNVKAHPAVKINKKTITGQLTSELLFEAVCSGLDTKPSLCNAYFMPSTKLESNKISLMTILIIILCLAILNIIIILLCRRYISKRIHQRIEDEGLDLDGRINNVVTNYIALNEKK